MYLQGDPLPDLVREFEAGRADGRSLLIGFRRHVDRVSRRYPDAWFALAQKTPEAVEDLSARVFSTCARVVKGRFPFLDRTPFRAYVEEQHDGRTIRFHSFYAKLSITREIMRADYVHNLSSHPALRWRADLYRRIGEILYRDAVASPQGRGLPPVWALPGPARVRAPDEVVEILRRSRSTEIADLVRLALQEGGPRSQSALTALIEGVLGAPVIEPAQEEAETDVATLLAVRAAVLEGWAALDPESRALLRLLADGADSHRIIAEIPRFRQKVAVSQALARIRDQLGARIAAAMGREVVAGAPPREVLELVMDVLGEIPEEGR